MGNAVSISGTTYTVRGTVLDQATNLGVLGLNVVLYEHDLIGKDNFLGIAVTDAQGGFQISFEASAFGKSILDREPDLYFLVDDGGTQVLSTKDNVINNANESSPDIVLLADLSEDKLRTLIVPVPVPGWIGGFAQSNSAFAYPDPNLGSLDMLGNLDNIPKLQRQQKVVWPEFSWETLPGEADPKRCYQMFAPDISRLGYTNEGRVYSIICPQQGASAPQLGSMNVEVTVTGNRGWADEATKELAADMTVEGKIWFSPSANEYRIVKWLGEHFESNGLPFPFTKENAIRVTTHLPGNAAQPIFPLRRGESTDFPIPAFSRHAELAWTVGHLGVQIGGIVKTGIEKVDVFNQTVLNIFNLASGNMLKEGNILTWNVWFTAPDHVDQVEWAEHAEKWRQSIDADHGSPDGNGTTARYFDGSPFKAVSTFFAEEESSLTSFIRNHIEV